MGTSVGPGSPVILQIYKILHYYYLKKFINIRRAFYICFKRKRLKDWPILVLLQPPGLSWAPDAKAEKALGSMVAAAPFLKSHGHIHTRPQKKLYTWLRALSRGKFVSLGTAGNKHPSNHIQSCVVAAPPPSVHLPPARVLILPHYSRSISG